jgi:flagellar hook-basal body complex protein FliE
VLICGSNHSALVSFYAFLENKDVQSAEMLRKIHDNFVRNYNTVYSLERGILMFIVPITPMEKMDFSEVKKVKTAAEATEGGFSSLLDNAINEFKEADKLSDIDNAQLSLGNADDLAQIQINALKAETMLQTTVQITSRVVNAYKEIMAIQV